MTQLPHDDGPYRAHPSDSSLVQARQDRGYEGHRRRRGLAAAAIAAVIAIGAGGALWAERGPTAPSAVVPRVTTGTGSGGAPSGGPGSAPGSRGQLNGPSATAASSTLPRATAAQQVGVVDIDTVLGYQDASAAGTGMVLTSSGEVLTNNHVVDGATSIKVTVVSTGVRYTAKVVGTDPTQDVAVLQLQGAAGLKTVKTSSATVGASEQVVGVGNAGGAGGTPSASTGQVTTTNATITASDEDGSSAETLHGLIQISADIQAGDSGGPLYDTSGQVIGIDTAVQVTTVEGTIKGYAIPIASALRIAARIESGTTSSTVHQGYPAFLGILLSGDPTDSTTGATVEQVLDNTGAAHVGLSAGDVITAIDAHRITGATSLQSVLATYRPGRHVTITWTDQEGRSQSASVVLTAGPAN